MLPDRIFYPVIAELIGDFSEVYGGFQRFDLTKKELTVSFRVNPVFEQVACGFGDTDIVAITPDGDALTDTVDKLIFLNAVLCPTRIQGQLFTFTPGFGFGDGDEVGTNAPGFLDFVGNAFIRKFKMPGWFLIRRI